MVDRSRDHRALHDSPDIQRTTRVMHREATRLRELAQSTTESTCSAAHGDSNSVVEVNTVARRTSNGIDDVHTLQLLDHGSPCSVQNVGMSVSLTGDLRRLRQDHCGYVSCVCYSTPPIVALFVFRFSFISLLSSSNYVFISGRP